MSSSLRYWHSGIAYALAIILLALCLGIAVAGAALAPKDPGLSLWLGFLFVMSTIGWIYGYTQANTIYSSCVWPAYNIQQMTSYPNVDPSTAEGNQFMDFGVISFTETATINQSMSMHFKDGVTYCVAPIVGHVDDKSKSDKSKKKSSPDSYDFWAVGVDCCEPATRVGHVDDKSKSDKSDKSDKSGKSKKKKKSLLSKPDKKSDKKSTKVKESDSVDDDEASDFGFKCGDWNLAAAHSGLRVSSESEKQFYQLAVNSAAATYNIPVRHPIFFTWVAQPVEEMNAWLSNVSKSIVNGTIVLLCVNVLLLAVALIPITWMHGSKH
jgi:hypothetical protein